MESLEGNAAKQGKPPSGSPPVCLAFLHLGETTLSLEKYCFIRYKIKRLYTTNDINQRYKHIFFCMYEKVIFFAGKGILFQNMQKNIYV